MAVIRDGCCTDSNTLVYTHSSPLTHLHTLCSSVPTSRIFVPWDLGNRFAISKIFSCLGWSLLTALRCRSHEDRAQPCAEYLPTDSQSSRLTEVHHSHFETDACWGIVWVRLPTSQVIVETKKLTLAFQRWRVSKIQKKKKSEYLAACLPAWSSAVTA